MKFRNRVMILCAIGFGLGVIFGLMITAISASYTYADGKLYLCSEDLVKAVGDPLKAFIIQAVASGIYGVISVGGTAVYDLEELGVIKCTVIHYVVMMTAFNVLAFSMRWFSAGNMREVITVLSIMTVIYIGIWIVNYVSHRKEQGAVKEE